ncbi:MAG: sigma-70 family RNA polymerase sigma factor [Elusimicrobiales bacterium]|nr:sigma-70 family RNA polymerase sigma factor [Elusimicrobiales bacterium]
MNIGKMTEEELAVAFADGSHAAFDELVNRCKADVFGFLLGLTGSRDMAEDLFQETFVKYVRNPGAYRPVQKFRAWLFTVARNTALDYFRREKNRTSLGILETPEDEEYDSEGTVVLGIKDRDSDRPDLMFENACLADRINSAIASLPQEQREIFYLRHYSGLSFKEISTLLGEPVGTVLSRMSRTAAVLREKLEEK